MLDKYWLYTLFHAESNVAFLDFIVALYEIPKREVDIQLSKSQKRKVREKYVEYFEMHGLLAEQLQSVRDAYVHRVMFIGDLRDCVQKLSVTSVMTYVDYFGLDISRDEISNKRYLTLEYLTGLCEVFGYVTVGSIKEGRFSPFKED